MAIQGKRLYRQALAGGGIAYLTYGWDAGVLGGIMQTKPFLEAMHVSRDHELLDGVFLVKVR